MKHRVERLAPDVWIEDNKLHARHGARLPALCVNCGAACTRPPDVRTYRGFGPNAWWLFLFKMAARKAVIRMFGNEAQVGAYLCDTHVRRMASMRRAGLLSFLCAPVLLVTLPIVLGKGNGGMAVLAAFALLLVGTFLRSLGKTLLVPLHVSKDGEAVFGVPAQAFLAAVRDSEPEPSPSLRPAA